MPPAPPFTEPESRPSAETLKVSLLSGDPNKTSILSNEADPSAPASVAVISHTVSWLNPPSSSSPDPPSIKMATGPAGSTLAKFTKSLPPPVRMENCWSPAATSGEANSIESSSAPSRSLEPVSSMKCSKLLKVIDSKATPPLVPEIRFCPFAGLSITMTSAPPDPVTGASNVNAPSTSFVPSMMTGSRPVKTMRLEPDSTTPSPKILPGV